MSQSSHINSNLMNSSMSANPSGPGAGDAGQNENENHLIGNILAEEDENSGKYSQNCLSLLSKILSKGF